MSLVMRGQVVGVETTKGGKWDRILLASGRRVNDLVMVPTGTVPAKSGQSVELPVRASVETNADGRPTKFITYWLDEQEGEGA